MKKLLNKSKLFIVYGLFAGVTLSAMNNDSSQSSSSSLAIATLPPSFSTSISSMDTDQGAGNLSVLPPEIQHKIFEEHLDYASAMKLAATSRYFWDRVTRKSYKVAVLTEMFRQLNYSWQQEFYKVLKTGIVMIVQKMSCGFTDEAEDREINQFLSFVIASKVPVTKVHWILVGPSGSMRLFRYDKEDFLRNRGLSNTSSLSSSQPYSSSSTSSTFVN